MGESCGLGTLSGCLMSTECFLAILGVFGQRQQASAMLEVSIYVKFQEMVKYFWLMVGKMVQI